MKKLLLIFLCIFGIQCFVNAQEVNDINDLFLESLNDDSFLDELQDNNKIIEEENEKIIREKEEERQREERRKKQKKRNKQMVCFAI